MTQEKKAVFSLIGSDKLLSDPSPIIENGAPRSTEGLANSTVPCDLIGIQLKLEKPKEKYLHGWGKQCLGAKMIV